MLGGSAIPLKWKRTRFNRSCCAVAARQVIAADTKLLMPALAFQVERLPPGWMETIRAVLADA